MPASQTTSPRPSPPQVLSEEALKEALQVPSIWVEIQDVQEAKCQEVEREVALLSPFIQREVLRSGHGLAQADPVILPKQVNSDVLNLLLDYCRFHRAPGRSDKERKLFDEKFIRLDTRRLCELTSAAAALDMKPLVDLTSRALARMIEGKSAEEIRETFHLPDDLTEEEKLEPVKNATADPRIRLLNRLYAKKRKELAYKKAEEAAAEARARKEAQPSRDDRPLEDLLSFIGTEPAGAKSKSKQKKKRGKKKNGMLPAASIDSEAAQAPEAHQSSDAFPATMLPNQISAQISEHPSCCSPSVILDKTLSGTANLSSTIIAAQALGTDASSGTAAADHSDNMPRQAHPQQTHAEQAEPSGQVQQEQRAMPGSNGTHGSASEWNQSNGHMGDSTFPAEIEGEAFLEDDRDITDEDDAALLADMQGFASALGCNWQAQGPDMVSLGTLPLPGAHITTLTSLANLKPSHADRSYANHHGTDSDGLSQSAGDDSHESELDTDDELEAAYDDRQAANLREANCAYDIAMSRVAAEDGQASFRPHWPDDPSHASHASFDDWATNASHAKGPATTLTSHGSFSFANGRQEKSAGHVLPHTSSTWPVLYQGSVQESSRGRIDVHAVQELFQDFLQKAGLDSHLEVRTLPSRDPAPHCQCNVAVQNVFPCGAFMKIQLS